MAWTEGAAKVFKVGFHYAINPFAVMSFDVCKILPPAVYYPALLHFIYLFIYCHNCHFLYYFKYINCKQTLIHISIKKKSPQNLRMEK